MVFHRCAFARAPSNCILERISCHKLDTYMVFHQCALACVPSSCFLERNSYHNVFLQYEQINVLHQCTLPCMYPNYLLEWMYLIILPNTRNVCNMTPKLKPFYKMAETPTLGVLKAPKHEEWVTDIFAHTGRVNLMVYAGIHTSGDNWHYRKSVCNRRTR